MQLPLLKNYIKDDNTTPIPTINHIEQYDSANQGNCITRHSHFKSKIAKLGKKQLSKMQREKNYIHFTLLCWTSCMA